MALLNNNNRNNFLGRKLVDFYGLVCNTLSLFPPLIDDIVQWIIGNTNGESLTDDLDPLIVTPEPGVVDVDCLYFNGVVGQDTKVSFENGGHTDNPHIYVVAELGTNASYNWIVGRRTAATGEAEWQLTQNELGKLVFDVWNNSGVKYVIRSTDVVARNLIYDIEAWYDRIANTINLKHRIHGEESWIVAIPEPVPVDMAFTGALGCAVGSQCWTSDYCHSGIISEVSITDHLSEELMLGCHFGKSVYDVSDYGNHGIISGTGTSWVKRDGISCYSLYKGFTFVPEVPGVPEVPATPPIPESLSYTMASHMGGEILTLDPGVTYNGYPVYSHVSHHGTMPGGGPWCFMYVSNEASEDDMYWQIVFFQEGFPYFNPFIPITSPPMTTEDWIAATWWMHPGVPQTTPIASINYVPEQPGTPLIPAIPPIPEHRCPSLESSTTHSANGNLLENLGGTVSNDAWCKFVQSDSDYTIMGGVSFWGNNVDTWYEKNHADFLAHANGNLGLWLQWKKMGPNNTCHLIEMIQYPIGTAFTLDQYNQVTIWAGDDCGYGMTPILRALDETAILTVDEKVIFIQPI